MAGNIFKGDGTWEDASGQQHGTPGGSSGNSELCQDVGNECHYSDNSVKYQNGTVHNATTGDYNH
jgi:hypothetical protein